MASYPVIREGFDATSVITAITRGQLLATVHDSQPQTDVGFIILADTAPDVSLYPVLARFRWAKTASGVLTGLFYYHDGTSWTLEVPAPGTILGSMIADNTIDISKLKADGDPFQIIRIRSDGSAFQFIDLIDAIDANSVPANKLVNAAAAYSFLVSNGSLVWAELGTASALNRLLPAATLVSTFNSMVNDHVVYFRGSNSTAEKQPIGMFGENLVIQSTYITATTASMAVPVIDLTATAGQRMRQVALSNFLPPSGVTAGTYTYPASITVGVNGLVTSVASGGASLVTSLGTVAIPAAAAVATLAHTFGTIPSIVRAVLKCSTTDQGYIAADEVPIEAFSWSAGNTGQAALIVAADIDNITFIRGSDAASIYITPKGGGAYVAIDTTKWQIKAYAIK